MVRAAVALSSTASRPVPAESRWPGRARKWRTHWCTKNTAECIL